jgi:hypothetical protein
MPIDGKSAAIEDEIQWAGESLRYTEQGSGSDNGHGPDPLDSVG